LLNTFRLGSEAIAVALYGSLLATLLDSQLRGTLSRLAPDPTTLQRWIDEVAAGNLTGSLQALGTEQAGTVHSLFIGGYDSAFHGVLWALALILLVLTAVVTWLVRPLRQQERVEAQLATR